MHYGTQTRAKFIYPYIKIPIDHTLSALARRRLKWMLYIHKGNTVAKCSRHFDIPLRTLWYWLKRFDIHKPKTLENKSRTPKNQRYSEIPLHQRERIVELRRKYRNWGREKIQVLLKKEGIFIGQTRIQTIINRSGLKRIHKKQHRKRTNRQHIYSVPKECMNIPGGLVYFDVKHLYLRSCGTKIYQFTAIDQATRYLFSKLYSNITSLSGKKFFLYVQKSLGSNRISYVGSDNGSEFLGFFEKVLSEQKVTHVFSSPHCPKQNPFVERVIRTIVDDHYTYNGLEINLTKQQEVLDKYLYIYNKIRPHHSLGNDTPYERYVKLSKSLTM